MPRTGPFFREIPRPRHEVSRRQLKLLRPFFRYSRVRDAYVLRLVGRRRGPVLRLKPARRPRPVPIVKTGGQPASTGGQPASTGGQPASTGGQPASTGGPSMHHNQPSA